MKLITDINKIDKVKWATFVKTHANGNIFQTPEYYCTNYSASGVSPFIYIVDKMSVTSQPPYDYYF